MMKIDLSPQERRLLVRGLNALLLHNMNLAARNATDTRQLDNFDKLRGQVEPLQRKLNR